MCSSNVYLSGSSRSDVSISVFLYMFSVLVFVYLFQLVRLSLVICMDACYDHLVICVSCLGVLFFFCLHLSWV